jgi:hypothetical protein
VAPAAPAAPAAPFSFLFFSFLSFWRASRHQKSAGDGTYLKSLPIRSYFGEFGLIWRSYKNFFFGIKRRVVAFSLPLIPGITSFYCDRRHVTHPFFGTFPPSASCPFSREDGRWTQAPSWRPLRSCRLPSFEASSWRRRCRRGRLAEAASLAATRRTTRRANDASSASCTRA